MGKKSTDAEIELRVNEIYKRYLMGYTYEDLVKYCKEPKKDKNGKLLKDNWKVTSSRTVAKYLEAAKEKLKAVALPGLEEARRRSIESYCVLLHLAYNAKRYTECRKILARIDKIQGLETDNINIQATGNLKIDDLKIGIMKINMNSISLNISRSVASRL